MKRCTLLRTFFFFLFFFRGTVCPRDSLCAHADKRVERKDQQRNGECPKRGRERERERWGKRGSTFPVCNYVGILTAEESFPDRAWLCIECNNFEMIVCLAVDAMLSTAIVRLCGPADHFLATPRSADLDPSFGETRHRSCVFFSIFLCHLNDTAILLE